MLVDGSCFTMSEKDTIITMTIMRLLKNASQKVLNDLQNDLRFTTISKTNEPTISLVNFVENHCLREVVIQHVRYSNLTVP